MRGARRRDERMQNHDQRSSSARAIDIIIIISKNIHAPSTPWHRARPRTPPSPCSSTHARSRTSPRSSSRRSRTRDASTSASMASSHRRAHSRSRSHPRRRSRRSRARRDAVSASRAARRGRRNYSPCLSCGSARTCARAGAVWRARWRASARSGSRHPREDQEALRVAREGRSNGSTVAMEGARIGVIREMKMKN